MTQIKPDDIRYRIENNPLPITDFRYGNLVYYKSTEDGWLPNSLDWQDFKWMEENPKTFWETFGGIPLSEQTFSATWYERQNESDIDCEWDFPFPSDNHVPLTHDSNGIFYYSSSGLFVKLMYLHELQNLYYSITGKELEIKDKDKLIFKQ